MTIYIKGKAIKLDPADAKGKGGEADIYSLGDFYKTGKQIAVKVFKQPDHPDYMSLPPDQRKVEQHGAVERLKIHQTKLLDFPKNMPSQIVTPIDTATDRSGNEIVGFTLEFLDSYELLLRYAEKSFRQLGITNEKVTSIFQDLHTCVKGVHAAKAVIGDFNDLNVMVRDNQVKLIDADSFQFGKYVCRTFTASFVDPTLCKPNPFASGPMLHAPHTEGSDWYAFNIMLMQCLLYLARGPYGGIYNPKDKKKRLNPSDRWQRRVTVFDPEVTYPKPATTYKVLPDDLLDYWFKLFVKDERVALPEKLLRLHWETCSCGTVHARSACPSCQTASTVRPTEITRISGKIKVKTVFPNKGTILHATTQNGVLKYLYHDGHSYRREDDSLILNGPLDTQTRFRICGENTIVGKSGILVSLDGGGVGWQIPVDSYGILPIFDTNANNSFWVVGGNLHRNKEIMGMRTSEIIGGVLMHQTQFWVGPKFGFGFYRAGAMSVAFVFDALTNGINDSVQIPIKGQLIDSTCVFSNSLCWFFFSAKEGSRINNHCFVIQKDGKVTATASAEKGSEPWLDSLRGKLPFGNSLFVPTDEGIFRYDVKGGMIEKSTEFPDTASVVDSGDILLAATNGIYVVSSHEIKEIRMINYTALSASADKWAKQQNISSASQDRVKVCMMLIDMQITFCFANAELPVIGALDDCNKAARMIYRDLACITEIDCTFDTHRAYQIFHAAMWIDQNGEHPTPFTVITEEDQKSGKWRIDPAVASTVMNGDYTYLVNHARHYSASLKKSDKDALIIWPYHSMLGGIGHALVPNIEEAVFFHSVARNVLMGTEIKGGNALTENYSILGPEVLMGFDGRTPIAQKNVRFIDKLLKFDKLVILGEAKDKCVGWTIDDLLREIKAKDPKLAEKVYLVEDCTSPVKVPNPAGGFFVDGTAAGNAAFQKFADAGMHVVQSTTPMEEWPDFNLD
jgi:nicotinamidase-related amidase